MTCAKLAILLFVKALRTLLYPTSPIPMTRLKLVTQQ
jgi:hypothetical protein